jgi:hypothetical protein
LFRLTPPLDDEVRRFIANQEHAEFSYPEVGASADSVPDGYTVDRNSRAVGRGVGHQHIEQPPASLGWRNKSLLLNSVLRHLTGILFQSLPFFAIGLIAWILLAKRIERVHRRGT